LWQNIFIETDNHLRNSNPNIEYRNSKQARITKIQMTQTESLLG
jgi:hypothetical protein